VAHRPSPAAGESCPETSSGEAVRVGLLGTGELGQAVAAELVADPAIFDVVLLSGSLRTHEAMRASLGSKLVSETAPPWDELDAVVLCTPDDGQAAQAGRALDSGCHVVSSADSVETVRALLALEGRAVGRDRSVVIGAAASPGLTTVLARHGAALFDDVAEICIGVTGTGGRECADRRARAGRTDSQEWRDGAWIDVAARSGTELLWFPEPVGAVDCSRGDLSEAVLLRRQLPGAAVISAKMGRPVARRTRRTRRFRIGRSNVALVEEPGALRVEVSGRRNGDWGTTVYGLVASPILSSAVLAATMARLVVAGDAKGVGGVGEFVEPSLIFEALWSREVRVQVYEGID